MKTSKYLLILMLILNIISLSQERRFVKDKEFVQKNEKWYQLYAGKEYEVNSTIITIKLKEGVTKSNYDAFLKNNNLKVIRSNELGFIDVEISKPEDVLSAVQRFVDNEIIEIAEVNTFGYWDAIPNDPRFPEQWNLEQTSDFDIDAAWGWDINTGSSSVVIGILDSGTKLDHEDLGLGFDGYQNIWTNSGEGGKPDDPRTGNGIDDDGNGFIDDWRGWDFYGIGPPNYFPDNDPNPSQFNINIIGSWHGTAVAGVASAKTNNGRGIASVPGGWGAPGAKLMILRIGDLLPDGSLIDEAILYASNNGARIINMSFDVPQTSAIDAAIQYAYNTKGVLLVAASGNQASSIRYPASHTNILAVGATDQNDVLAQFSNYGHKQSVCAPGVSILTTWPDPNYPYAFVNGTSFAAPHVAGVAALILSASPHINNVSLKNILESSAEDRGAVGWDEKYGHGRVSAYKALRYTFTNYGGQIKSKVNNGWNMTSIPLQLLNYSKSVVYPTATSPAWQLVGTNYVAADPLSNGVGYWIRFGSEQDITYTPWGIFSIDMPVHAGWNIVGSITQTVGTNQVEPMNTSIQSSFFEYNNGYEVSNVIKSGKGYWVKVSNAGILRINLP